MRILLLSTNRTVQKMIALAVRDVSECELVLSPASDEVEQGMYDVMFVDDTVPLYRESLTMAEDLGHPVTVLLYQETAEDDSGFDHRLKKPFLPSEIREIVERYTQKEPEETKVEGEKPVDKEGEQSPPKKKKKKNKSKREKKKTFRAETEVLNLDEIETIKALLEEDGLEIVHEEELAEKMLKEHKGDEKDRHDALIRALRTMKPRKIRKLLKGATVRVEIVFADTKK